MTKGHGGKTLYCKKTKQFRTLFLGTFTLHNEHT